LEDKIAKHAPKEQRIEIVDTELVESRRKAILDAAMALFDRQGYASTTIDEVAAAAGISKGSIYNYFESKQDLFTQLFNQAILQDEADVDALLAGPMSAGRKLCMMLDYWHHGLAVDLKIGRLTLEFWATAARETRSGALAENLHAAYGRWIGRIGRIIQEGLDRGEVDRTVIPDDHATLFLGLIHGLVLHAILGIGSRVDERFLASMKQSVLGGLGIRPVPDSTQE
jgi:AcrR family transcriptional regulator